MCTPSEQTFTLIWISETKSELEGIKRIMSFPSVSTQFSDIFNEFIYRRWQDALQSTPGALHCAEMLGQMSKNSRLFQ